MNKNIPIIILFFVSSSSFLQSTEFLKEPFVLSDLTDRLYHKFEYYHEKLANAGYIDSVAWHPQEKVLAVTTIVGCQSTTKIVDLLKGTVVEPLTSYIKNRSIAWHPNGKLLALGGSQDRENAMIVSIEDNKIEHHTILPFLGSVGPWDHKGERLIGYWSDGGMKVFNVMQDEVEMTFAHDVESVAWNPCKNLLATRLQNGRIKIMCSSSLKELSVNSAKNVRSLAWHSNGEFLITGSFAGKIKIIDIITQQAIILLDQGYTIRSIAMISSHKGFTFAVGPSLKMLAFD